MPLLSFRLHFAKILRATSCSIAAHVHQLQGEGHGRTLSLFRLARKPSILFQGRTLNHSRVCSGFVSLCGRNIFESGAPTERQVSAFLCRRLTNSFYQGKGQGTEGVRGNNQFRSRNKTTAIYVVAIGVTVLGLSYAAVPLYRLYCQVMLSYVIIIYARFQGPQSHILMTGWGLKFWLKVFFLGLWKTPGFFWVAKKQRDFLGLWKKD